MSKNSIKVMLTVAPENELLVRRGLQKGGRVSMYLGDTAISSSGGGTSAGSVVLMTQGTVAAYGVATVPESEEV